MTRLIPARLNPILNRPFEDLEEGDLGSLVGVREGEDLDFKQQPYPQTRDASRELAEDVVSFANRWGGLLVIGIEERRGEAVALAPFPLPGREEDLRMHQVVASLVAPRPDMRVRLVPSSDPGKGYILAAIPRSPLAPHAVVHGDRLRYVTRTGPGKRSLSESEVADAYRNRFVAAEASVERLDRIQAEAIGQFDRSERPWLVMSILPSLPGSIELRIGVPERLRDWASGFRNKTLPGSWFQETALDTSVGMRRIMLREGGTRGTPCWFYGDLYTDGAAVAAGVIGYPRRSERVDTPGIDLSQEEGEVLIVSDEALSMRTADLLLLLASHAVENAGTWGEAIIQAEIIPREGASRMLLYQSRSNWWGPLSGTRLIERTGLSKHTVDLEEVARPSSTLLIAARMVVNDLMAAFGLPESQQLSPNGELRRLYLRRDIIPQVGRWADLHNVAFTDERLLP